MKLNTLDNFLFLLSHGAGAGIDSDFMVDITHQLNDVGLKTIPFNFPYMDIMKETGKRRPPDRMPKLIESFRQKIVEVSKKYPEKKIIIGGKSMGGRVASLVTVELESIKPKTIEACICLGFPFHPPKKLDKYRGEHLVDIKTPTLILQGERDPMGTNKEVKNYDFSPLVTVKAIPDGDHSFKPRVKSGYTLAQNISLCISTIRTFVRALD